jgi:DNA-binding PadR family transcriptional regulator
MSATKSLPALELHPASRTTITGMLAKGWIERDADASSGERYRITPAGQAALKAKIPTKR